MPMTILIVIILTRATPTWRIWRTLPHRRQQTATASSLLSAHARCSDEQQAGAAPLSNAMHAKRNARETRCTLGAARGGERRGAARSGSGEVGGRYREMPGNSSAKREEEDGGAQGARAQDRNTVTPSSVALLLLRAVSKLASASGCYDGTEHPGRATRGMRWCSCASPGLLIYSHASTQSSPQLRPPP